VATQLRDKLVELNEKICGLRLIPAIDGKEDEEKLEENGKEHFKKRLRKR
jgi:hypothetical protein